MTRPHVTLKLATSLDGRIATASGESRWISGELARAEVQKLRARANAVMVGAGTVRADDPELLARTDPPPARQPLRVVLNTRLDLPATGKLFASLAQAPLLVIGAEGDGAALAAAGAEIARVKARVGGVDAAAALGELKRRGIGRVLVEGGGKLAAALIAANLVDRLEWMRAPLILGEEGRPAVGPLALSLLADAPKWVRVAVRPLGPDLWESYERA